MTKTEKQLVVQLLNKAADVFGYHGCNDFDLKHWIPNLNERRAFIKEYYEYNGTPEEYDPTRNYENYNDWALMTFLAYKMESEID